MTDAILAEVERYISHGWDWGVVVALINFRFGRHFTSLSLKEACTAYSDRRCGPALEAQAEG